MHMHQVKENEGMDGSLKILKFESILLLSDDSCVLYRFFDKSTFSYCEDITTLDREWQTKFNIEKYTVI